MKSNKTKTIAGLPQKMLDSHQLLLLGLDCTQHLSQSAKGPYKNHIT